MGNQEGTAYLALEVFIACLSIKIRFGGLGWLGDLDCPRSSVESNLCPPLQAKNLVCYHCMEPSLGCFTACGLMEFSKKTEDP